MTVCFIKCQLADTFICSNHSRFSLLCSGKCSMRAQVSGGATFHKWSGLWVGPLRGHHFLCVHFTHSLTTDLSHHSFQQHTPNRTLVYGRFIVHIRCTCILQCAFWSRYLLFLTCSVLSCTTVPFMSYVPCVSYVCYVPYVSLPFVMFAQFGTSN